MAIKYFYIGSVGPFAYEDTDALNDPDSLFPGGTLQDALTTTGKILVLGSSIYGFSIGLADIGEDHYLILDVNEELTADRTLNILVGDTNRILTLSGNPTLADWFDQAVKAASSPVFVTTKLSGLTDGYIPYHVDDATGLANGPTKTNVDDAITKKHATGADTALGVLGTKNPPIDADKALYRDSTDSDALVTSTWTQIKAFLKTYYDTIYHIVGGALGTPTSGTLTNCTGLPAAAGIVAGVANLKLFTNAGATAPEWAAGIKTGIFTIDTATASGTQAVSGVGFKPSNIIFFAVVHNTSEMSVGIDDGTTHPSIGNAYNVVAGRWYYIVSSSIYLIQTGAIYYTGVISALDTDGFTITWVKTGAKTGTATILYMAYR